MIHGTDSEKADKIFKKISDKFGGEVQGLCAYIAMHILGELVREGDPDPIPVAGFLTSSTGWKCAHWWVEKGGMVYDPMGDIYQNEPGFKRIVVHQDWKEFCVEYHRQKIRSGL